jgi:hypothetical protein
MSHQRPNPPRSSSPIFSRTYDLLLWLIRATTRFPRSQRFVLARTVQWTVLQFQERIIEAGMLDKRDPAAALDRLERADLLLIKLRFYLRLCHDLSLLSDGQYAHVAGMVEEVGRLLGGWIKKVRPRAKGAPAQGALDAVQPALV